MTTQDLIKRLRNFGPLGKIMEELVIVAADRLEELQRMNDSMQVDRELWIKVGREKLEQAIKERDEALAEVERLKRELHDTIDSYKLNNLQPKTTRPEPSRLEIAAMLKAGWFANRDADFNATDHKWWVEQADALIAAAREAK